MISEVVHSLFRNEIKKRYGDKQGVVAQSASEAFLLWILNPNAKEIISKAVKQKQFESSPLDSKPTRDPAKSVQVETEEPVVKAVKKIPIKKTKPIKEPTPHSKKLVEKVKKAMEEKEPEEVQEPVKSPEPITIKEPEQIVPEVPMPAPVTIPEPEPVKETKVDPEPHGIKAEKLGEMEIILNPNEWLLMQKDKPYAELQKECVRLVTKGDGYSLTLYELLMGFIQIKFGMQVMKPE